MSIVQFQKDIRLNELRPFYIISGEEIGLINYYISQIKSPIKREESVKSVWTRLTNRGIISSNDVYVIRDDKEFMSSKPQWSKLEQIKYGTLILLVTKFDKRSEFYKTHVDQWIEFETMTAVQLEKYFVKNYPYKAKELRHVIDLCERNFTRIENELDKLSRTSLTQSIGVIKAADILIQRDESVEIFGVVNQVIAYRIHEAIESVDVMLSNGESMIGLLTLLYNNFINAAKVLGTGKPTEESLGIKKFQITTIKNNFNYSLESAFEGINIIADAINGIKVGKYTERSAIYFTLLKINQLS